MIMIGTLPTTARWGKWAGKLHRLWRFSEQALIGIFLGFFMSVTVNAAPFRKWYREFHVRPLSSNQSFW
jgi:hypothetical protein